MDTRESIAFHEAGHSVTALWLGQRVRFVTITVQVLWEGEHAQIVYGGHCASAYKGRSRPWRSLQVALAGPMAEIMSGGVSFNHLLGRMGEFANSTDFKNVDYWAKQIFRRQPTFNAFRRAIPAVWRLLRKKCVWRAIADIATAMLKRTTLEEQEVIQIYRAATQQYLFGPLATVV